MSEVCWSFERLSVKKQIKLNIGCGPNGQFEGFDNLDNSPSVTISKYPLIKKLLLFFGMVTKDQFEANWDKVIKCDASKRLPYKDESVNIIYSSHFLEHIPEEKGIQVLRECYRVLIKGGVMRLVVPDLLWYAEHYVTETRKIVSGKTISNDRSIHDKFLNTVYGAYIKRKRYGAEHCYMYDLPTLNQCLINAGFQDIRSVCYREGFNTELASYDNRPDDSLHLEIRK